jgi:uncharacterized Zn finger protein
MAEPLISEAEIHRHAGGTIMGRGEDYHERGMVSAVVRRGDMLVADVEGSELMPYRVRVTLDADSVGSATCSCPYGIEYAGWCKHIVATLLVAARDPGRIEEQPPLEERLAALDADQLRQLLLRMIEKQPELYDLAATLIAVEAATAAAAGDAPPVRVDARDVRRRVRGVMRSLDRMRASEAYWYTGGMVDGVREVLQEARAFLEAGDGRSAIAVLEPLTDEYVDDWTDFDDSEGELGGFFEELGAVWAEAILSADLTPAERERLAERLEEWDDEIDNYGVESFFVAREAAREGWDHPHLVRVLRGEGMPEQDDDWYSEDLVETRLDVLERQGRVEEALRLAEVEGQTARHLALLARLGRVEEAVALGLERITTTGQALYVAERLHAQGATEEALRLGEHGLDLQPAPSRESDGFVAHDPVRADLHPLARRVRDLAAEQGRPQLALRAARIALVEEPDLPAYLRVQELAGERWSEVRDELLEELRRERRYRPAGTVEIFLHEGLLADALDAVEESWDYTLIARVADAAATTHPERVIPLCVKQAEPIMEGGKADRYHHAARWLERARTAYLAAGRAEEWKAYLEATITKHYRKYKLRPMLEALRRMPGM